MPTISAVVIYWSVTFSPSRCRCRSYRSTAIPDRWYIRFEVSSLYSSTGWYSNLFSPDQPHGRCHPPPDFRFRHHRTTARVSGRQVFQQQFGCHGRVPPVVVVGGGRDTDIMVCVGRLNFIGIAFRCQSLRDCYHSGRCISSTAPSVSLAALSASRSPFRIANRPVHRDLIANVETALSPSITILRSPRSIVTVTRDLCRYPRFYPPHG